MLFTLCRRRRKVWIFLGLFWVAFRKWTPFIKRIETVTLAFLWWRELNISVRTNSIRSFFRSIMVLRLGIMCYRHSCLFFFKLHFYFLFFIFRQEPCLQQVVFLPQEVLHLSHSQEQHLGWWVSFFCYMALPSLSRNLLTLLSFTAPSRSRCTHDAPAASYVWAAYDEATIWSCHWPWCTGGC